MYSVREVARILRVSPARLRYWERTALVQPRVAAQPRAGASSGAPPTTDAQLRTSVPSRTGAQLRSGAAPPALFGFDDLVGLRSLMALLERGIPLRRIRRTLASVRQRIPDLDRPLSALRWSVAGAGHVLVRHQGVLLEPDGQLVLELQAPAPQAQAVAKLSRRDAEPQREEPRTALEWFERGCALDSDPATIPAAIEAYARALELDPQLADAHCNLGTVHYNHGRRPLARTCYERALACEPDHVEAHFNLANLLEEEERNEAALRHYKIAMRGDPMYADVQLNLALLYEKLGLRRKAREHWRRYLQLEPAGAWAEVARKHLGD